MRRDFFVDSASCDRHTKTFAQMEKTFEHSNTKFLARLEHKSLDTFFEDFNVEVNEKPNSDFGKFHIR